ncbi:MAG: preprotein translocase subunit SecA [Sorangiineae bacterium NIC37A_2]|jgi:preprotein translocase subunit SecA|nr:MAG: preprotein translocase subunit SecA [Sorangiineae bacterium NIC37A_2]
MLTWVVKNLFGTSNERAVKRMLPIVDRINSLEAKIKALSDAELQAQTAHFKERLDNGESLDSILPEAFATCREASRRVLGMRHYDVQLLGGMVLHDGKIAEMRTGEGKTLVATLAVYLNALEGRGVHVVTVNDYLARRDAEWMGRLYNWLGLTYGVIVSQQSTSEKIKAYKADITYGQNNEFGFDYLRDNMKDSALEHVQRALHFAIVDEVDSILIDEARTPLIISGPADAASDKYRTLNEVITRLTKDEHYSVDEKAFSVTFTDEGIELVQKLTGIRNLYDPINIQSLHILNQLLKAHALYKRDQQYMVTPDGKVLIIDEYTGRVLAGRRWSDGLHQAVEAKENVRIQEESRTMATITFQNLFRLYKKLSGMTGTAQTEATEFMSTYKLDVVTIPTNRPIQRIDYHDVVYKTEREKFAAVVREILEMNAQGRPVLVGTTSVEKSAALSRILTKKGIAHQVLNAKHHENEAYVVAQAGRKGAITVSTNMAGRGTDIMLGGNAEMLARDEFIKSGRNPDEEREAFEATVAVWAEKCKAEQQEVKELGGLHILGTERHESRRIDNQLRGRAGRQGDPGSSRFYLSLEDDLMRIFGGDRVKNIMDRMGMPDDEPIEHPMVSKSIQNAQRKVEERNFDARKNTLEYDDVMNAQRRTLYGLRQQLGLGRYAPEELDDLGKPTGKTRVIPKDPDIEKRITPLVAQLVAMFCENPPPLKDQNGKSRTPTREELEAGGNIQDIEALQHEAYNLWGIKLDLETRKKRTPVSVYDELSDLAVQGLSEQKERLLDLIDRVVAAIVEENCPPQKMPEDWDFKAIADAFADIFGRKLDVRLEQFGSADAIVREVYRAAEEIYAARERSMGIDLLLRVFRYLYTQGLDQAWVDHLQNMEHLRDGIGLRGYGQRDPKNEYKKEGYNLFLNMMASVSSKVLTRLFEVQIEGQQEIAAMEREFEEKQQRELEQAVAMHEGDPESAEPGADLDAARKSVMKARVEPTSKPPVERSDLCPCGSGKKFRDCHGAALED